MQRVRLSLPYLKEFGWQSHVLAIAPDSSVQVFEPRLLETVPTDVNVTRVNALPVGLTSWFGLRNLGWRAWISLFAAGCRLLRAEKYDVVYFSTTQFICLPMGRLWRCLFGVPFVIDLQDPWFNDYYSNNPSAARPGGRKYLLAHVSAWLLERWTLRRCAGIISVSASYPKVLRQRYPWLKEIPMEVIPFGVDERDFQFLSRSPVTQDLFPIGDGCAHVVSIGRGGDDLLKAVGALFTSLARLAERDSSAASRLRIHFAGTNYASEGRAQPMFVELAHKRGVSTSFHERPWRLGYFESLQCQLDADAVLVLGSDDASYSPSKLYSVLLTGRPVVAIVLAGSLLDIRLNMTPAIHKLTYDERGTVITGMSGLLDFWRALVESPRQKRDVRAVLNTLGDTSFHARTLTKSQVIFLETAIAMERPINHA